MTAECSNTGSRDSELPTFDFCVASAQLEQPPSAENMSELNCMSKQGKPEAAALVTIANMETATIWPRRDQQWTPAEESELEGQLEDRFNFSLSARRSTIACRMRATTSTVEDVTISLQDDECIMLGRGPALLTLKDVTFEGVYCP